jgi:predicted dithiol-disulfide oxidoreductase (DUF899 family)
LKNPGVAEVEDAPSAATRQLLDVFECRRQLIAYYFMWWPGRPAAEHAEPQSVLAGASAGGSERC